MLPVVREGLLGRQKHDVAAHDGRAALQDALVWVEHDEPLFDGGAVGQDGARFVKE